MAALKPPAADQAEDPGPEGDWFCCQWTHPVSRQSTCAPMRHRLKCQGLEDGKVFEAPNFCHAFKAICTTVQ
jgi:hypothetical protein